MVPIYLVGFYIRTSFWDYANNRQKQKEKRKKIVLLFTLSGPKFIFSTTANLLQKNKMEKHVIDTVEKCYNSAAQNFQATVLHDQNRFDGQAVDYFETHLPNKQILQLGFGNGTPLGKRFCEQNFLYEGIELSQKQVQLAHKLMPIFKENFNKAEMTEFCEKASDSHFGGIVSTFAILHLTPAQQLNVFSQIHRILVPDGLFLFATIDNASTFVNKKAGKEKMRIGFCENYLSDKSCYEATFPVLWYQMTLTTLGFEFLLKQPFQGYFGGILQPYSVMVFRKKEILSI